MFHMFFVAGGLAFWILSAVVTVLILVALDRDSGWGAFWSLLGFCAVFTIWGQGVKRLMSLVPNVSLRRG